MDFLSCIQACVAMTPNPNWTPPVGVLIVRFNIALWATEIEFLYADEEPRGGTQHTKGVARIRNWRGEPCFGGGIDFATGNLDTKCSAGCIVRRLAGPDDVRALIRLWDSRIMVDEWLDSVAEYEPGLRVESKTMLVGVARGTLR